MAGIPEDLVDLLTSDRLGHVASIRPEGSIAVHPMWIDWDGRHILTSSPVGSRKGRNWRLNPQASVSVVDSDDPWRFLVIRGRVADILPDEDLAFIDKVSLRYVGAVLPPRVTARDLPDPPDHVQASRGRR